MKTKLCVLIGVLMLVIGLASCGSSSGSQTTPPPVTYTIGGTVSGLSGTGLVLQDNGGNNLSISGNGSFTFSAAINAGSSYNVTVLTQPSNPTQTCTVTNGNGTANANVTNVQVTCVTTYTIGGTVSGLSGTGLVLQNNGGNNLPISGNGSFTFSAAINAGSSYNVTVLTQPSNPTQTCTVTNGNGAANANVTNVQVTCVTTYTIGGTVSGLSGTGLVLQNNGGNNLPISGNGSFTFSAAINAGSSYNVTVLTQPSNPTQTCTVTNGNGTANANVTNVQVTCVTAYTIGGTVVNLATGDSLQLQDNGGDTLTVTANGSFTFATALSTGSSYDVTVSAQPTSPAQTCSVTDGSGTATANVTNVAVDCGHNEWTWVGGSKTVGQAGVYGAEGYAAASNVPGARYGAVAWTDVSGNLWLFGGLGYGSAGAPGDLNDLWEYSAGEWTWTSGSNTVNQPGVYGTGTGGPYPGARSYATSWPNSSGLLWLFGGQGYDSAGNQGYLNDLWDYGSGSWYFTSGWNIVNKPGLYGIEGHATPNYYPGARDAAVSWGDTMGNLWLFGGYGYDSADNLGALNDLWKYGTGGWAWMSGSEFANQAGVYGNPGAVPGARQAAVSWIDASGNLWLFGGVGFDSAGTTGYLNDLWEYSGGTWTWVSGSKTVRQSGIYGIQGTPAQGNVPGARGLAVSWIDKGGDLWLFGGMGLDSKGNQGDLNDLWKYSGGEWTWMKGSNTVKQSGTYGAQGTAAPGNVPGSRDSAVAWIDSTGNLWLFGGWAYDSTGTNGPINDLWRYEP